MSWGRNWTRGAPNGWRPAPRPPAPLDRSVYLALDAGVDLVQQPTGVSEVEVVAQVAGGFLARGAVERHVQGDQPRALRVATLVGGLGLVKAIGVTAIAGHGLEFDGLGRGRRLRPLPGR